MHTLTIATGSKYSVVLTRPKLWLRSPLCQDPSLHLPPWLPKLRTSPCTRLFFKLNRSMPSYEIPHEWPILGITEDNEKDKGISSSPPCGDVDGMGKEGAAECLLLPMHFVELEHESDGWGLSSSSSQCCIPLLTLSSFTSLITTTSLCRALLPSLINIVSTEEEVVWWCSVGVWVDTVCATGHLRDDTWCQDLREHEVPSPAGVRSVLK